MTSAHGSAEDSVHAYPVARQNRRTLAGNWEARVSGNRCGACWSLPSSQTPTCSSPDA